MEKFPKFDFNDAHLKSKWNYTLIDHAIELRQLAYDSALHHKSVVEQLVENISNEVIDTHGLTFYLVVRQDVDRVVGGFIRNLQDTENSKLRRTLSISQYYLKQTVSSSLPSTQLFIRMKACRKLLRLPLLVPSRFSNCMKPLWIVSRTIKYQM